MDDFLANKIIEDLMLGTMTAQEAWSNLQEGREVISDEKHDEITALITEQLIEADLVEDTEELELDNLFSEEEKIDLEWDDAFYQSDWEYGAIVSFDPDPFNED